MAKTYHEKLKDPRWQKKRLEIMEAAEFECEWCGDKEKTLNVHHGRYKKGLQPWEYDAKYLSCLCEECHKSQHEKKDMLDEIIALGPHALDGVIGYAYGSNVDFTEDDIFPLPEWSPESITGVCHALGAESDEIMNLISLGNIPNGSFFRAIHEKISVTRAHAYKLRKKFLSFLDSEKVRNG